MMPQVFQEVAPARAAVQQQRQQGQRVGLVPTMGALHDGHLSLVDEAHRVCDRVWVTIFVNPTQFGPGEDYDRYPRTWDNDLESLAARNVDAIFAPQVDTMYPPTASTYVAPPQVAKTLEGEFRPEHFRGVTTIVMKLFQILPANEAFFGRKDYQQCLVIRDMVRDLDVPMQLTFCPTIRESDGLAMSSRNRYLTDEQRRQAVSISQGLFSARDLVDQGEQCPRRAEQVIRATLEEAGVNNIDYVAVRDAETLQPIERIERDAVALVAAYVGATRLIDNVQLVRSSA